MTVGPKHKVAQDEIEIEAALARIGGDETVRFRLDRSGNATERVSAPRGKGAAGIFGSGGALRLADDLESLRWLRREGHGA